MAFFHSELGMSISDRHKYLPDYTRRIRIPSTTVATEKQDIDAGLRQIQDINTALDPTKTFSRHGSR